MSFYCLDCSRERNRRWYRESRQKRGEVVRDHSWVPEGQRWCPTCRQAVPVAEYVRNRRNASGFGSRCKACHNVENKKRYFVRRYGLDEADVAALRAKQGDTCLLCGEADPGHLDHDHDTGRVRGLLCERCNLGLGLFRDDPITLRAASAYVERHRVLTGPAPAAGPTPELLAAVVDRLREVTPAELVLRGMLLARRSLLDADTSGYRPHHLS